MGIAKKMNLQHIQNKEKFMKILLIKEWKKIQDLNKQIDFNNLTYYKGKNNPQNFISFDGPLGFYRSTRCF